MGALVSFVAVLGLVLVHLLAARLRFLEGTPRSRWLSIAGGISVAYVFLHLLPELGKSQEVIARNVGAAFAFVENHVYLIVLLGLAVFYGLDRLALASRQRRPGNGEADRTSGSVFALHIGSFAVYNVIIGYLLLHREDNSMRTFLLFWLAMGLHFVVNDYGLREHHKDDYDRIGRWVLAAAVVAGWAIGMATDVGETWIAVLLGFLAGGVILNVLKEELPEERASRFSAFAIGAGLYALILLAL